MKIAIRILMLLCGCYFIAESQWLQSGPAEVQVLSMGVSANGALYAGAKDNRSNNGFGMFKSTDQGESWAAINTGLPVYQSTNGVVRSIATKNDTIFIYHGQHATDTPKLYRSVNDGGNWSVVTTPMDLNTIITTQNAVLIGNGFAVYRSLNGGASWTLSKATSKFYTLFSAGGKLYLHGDSLYISADEGATWTFKKKFTSVSSPLLWSDGTTMFGSYVTNDRLSRSTDDGVSWTDLSFFTGYPRTVYFHAGKKFLVTDIGSSTDLTLSSTDNGATWDTVKNLRKYSEPYVHTMLIAGSNMYSGFGKIGVIKSTDNGVTWSLKHKGLPPRITVNQLKQVGSDVFIAVNKFAFFCSSNNGQTWDQSAEGIQNDTHFHDFLISGDTILAATSRGYYRSIDKGKTWSKQGSNTTEMKSILSWNGKIYSGSNGVSFSTNGGLTWVDMNNGLLVPGYGMKLLHNRLFYFTQSAGLWMWADTSTKWVQVGKDSLGTNSSINNIVSSNGRLYISTGLNNAAGAVYFSDDNGITWSRTVNYPYDYGNVLVRGAVYISAHNNVLIAAVGGQFKQSAVYMSVDAGITWSDITGDIPNTSGPLRVRETFKIGSDLIVPLTSYSGLGYSLYNRTLSALSVKNISTKVPEGYLLFQNYPNPFNPSTEIRFAISQRGFTTLTVYDLLGKEKLTLVDEVLNAGTYNFTFSAKNLSSGIYFYRLQTESFSETKRMFLIK